MHTLHAIHDVRKVALWLGHATLQSTEIYLRADPTEKLEALAAMQPPTLIRGSFKAPDKVIAVLHDVLYRKGHDGLAALVQSMLAEDPFTVRVFVFRSKRADRLKILFWDGSGLVMVYKRLEASTFTWPSIRDGVVTLNRAQFKALFVRLDWRRVRSLEVRRPAVAE